MEKEKLENKLLRARVAMVNKDRYILENNNKKITAEVSGRYKYISFKKSDYPVVGDYVFYHDAGNDFGIIERLETRKNHISRIDVGNIMEEHILASNIDIAFICMSMNKDFNLKKLQNFLSLTYGKGIETIILLTKKDLTDRHDHYIREVRKINQEEIITICSFDKEDLRVIKNHIGDKTAVFLGSSGVGKSTIINGLCGEEHFETADIRHTDDQGRHTTAHRELIHLKDGGCVIDTPGIRVVSSYFVDEKNFEDILNLSEKCHYRDCTHTNEPGCYVLHCLEKGDLSEQRYSQYLKVQKLNRFNAKRALERERMLNKRKRF